MKKLYFTISILLFGLSNAQLYTPNGNVNGVTTNPQTGNVGIGILTPTSKLTVAGDIAYGEALSNTLYRHDAGAYGTNIKSGFYQTDNPINFPSGASSWWHLLDVRHSNSGNNYALQIAGSFFDQDLWFRKTNDNANQSWRKIISENSNGNVGVGTNTPNVKLDVVGGINIASSFPIQLNGNDPSHGLKYKRYYSDGTNLLDGPFLYGWDGGSLGYKNAETEVHVLNWKRDKVGIGTNNPQTKLDVVGTSSFSDNMKVNAKLEAKEIKVTTTPTADFVFATDYDLPKLEEVEKHIKEKKHLPEIASAKEMEKEGVNVGEFQIKLLQKIEELTLYTIEQNKQIKQQQDQLKLQKEEINQLKSQNKEISELKQMVQALQTKNNQ